MLERILMTVSLSPSSQWALNVGLICVGACICLGFWTPVMSGVEAGAELLIVLFHPSQYESHLLLAILAASLAMLGPGAWSIDSVIFGRKRITV